MLPENVQLISGPGCPVCVTPEEVIDGVLSLTARKDLIITAYGDMMRVPGSTRGDNLARRRDINSWNIALDENLRPEDIQIEERDESGYVWENPMIRLHTRCYKAPFLYPVYPIRTTEPMTDRQFVTHELPLTLEPYGCTNLRITFFPRADMTSLSEKS